MATEAGVAYIGLRYDPGDIQKLAATTRAEGDKLARSWTESGKKAGAGLRSIGSSLTRSVTLPVGLAGAAAVKLATDFDTSLNHIQALVGANKSEMDLYRKSILALAPAVGKGPKELADALYFITSSGFKGAAALDVLKQSAQASAAGLGDTQTVADLVTTAINVYGHANLTAAQATDALTTAVRDGKGEPADYATSLGRVIPVAQNLGISFDQVSAALASLTLGGFSADKATTGLSSIFTNLAKPSTSAAAALASVGLSAGQIRTEIRQKGLLPALQTLNTAFHGNQVELRKVFTSGKAIVPFLSLTGQAAKRNVKIFGDLAHSTGATATAFKKASGTESFKFQQALAALQVAGITLGEQLVPILVRVAGAVTSLAKSFNGLSPGAKSTILIIAGFAVVLGPLVGLIGAIITVVSGAAAAFTALAAGEFLAAAPITLIVIGLAALAVGLVIAYKRSATFRAVVQAAMHAVAGAVEIAIAVVRRLGQIGLAVFNAIRGAISHVNPTLLAIIVPMSILISHFGTVRQVGVAAFNALRGAISGVIGIAQSIAGIIGGIVSAVERLASAASSAVHSITSGGPTQAQGYSGRYGTNKHAAGGIITRPLIAGNDLFGEAGREAVIPLDNPTGAAALATAMQGIGIHVYVGNEPVDARVRVAMKNTARSIQAGRKWSQ